MSIAIEELNQITEFIDNHFRTGHTRPMRISSIALVAALVLVSVQQAFAQKDVVDASIQRRSDASWSMARSIWGFAEVGYKEKKSSRFSLLP